MNYLSDYPSYNNIFNNNNIIIFNNLMKYLVKTNDYASLETVDYGRVVYDTANDKVFLQNMGGGVVKYKTIDLGLHSNLLWADRNIGASTPEEAGLYFQWGDTQGYTAEQVGDGDGLKAFSWADYKFSIDGSSSNFSKYNASDSKTVLDLEDDAAHVNMGGNWRMPTENEFIELCMYTDIYLVPNEGAEIQGTAKELYGGIKIEWTSQTEGTLKGLKFYKKGDKQTYMFVPAAGGASRGSMRNVGQYGDLWSSSLVSSVVRDAWYFGFSANGGRVINVYDRYHGLPVRGVLAQ